MTQFYSDEHRETEPHALPDCETFFRERGEVWFSGSGEEYSAEDVSLLDAADGIYTPCEEGWYYWACFPGCLPDGDARGPFYTEQEAIDDAREQYLSD